MKRIALVLALLLIPTIVTADAEKKPPAVAAGPAAFERLKGLVGEWTAVGEAAQTSTSFELLANGSALVERLKPGPEGTMVNVYHADGASVVMTHYCMAGNQPRYRCSKDGNSLAFAMTDITNWKKGEARMTGVTVTLVDADHMSEEWTSEMNGKTETFSMAFERKK